MANKVITPTIHTINALNNFGDWLTKKMKETHTSDEKLAKVVGLNRKTILRYRHSQGTPKLDTVAAIFAYFEEPAIHISLLNEEGRHD